MIEILLSIQIHALGFDRSGTTMAAEYHCYNIRLAAQGELIHELLTVFGADTYAIIVTKHRAEV